MPLMKFIKKFNLHKYLVSEEVATKLKDAAREKAIEKLDSLPQVKKLKTFLYINFGVSATAVIISIVALTT